MNDTEIIKAVAELDGLVRRQALNGTTWAWFRESRRITEWTDVFNQVEGLPRYLTSYDAIIPLIQKQWNDNQQFNQQGFYNGLGGYFPHVLTFIGEITPSQLCEALLRATGKWKE